MMKKYYLISLCLLLVSPISFADLSISPPTELQKSLIAITIVMALILVGILVWLFLLMRVVKGNKVMLSKNDSLNLDKLKEMLEGYINSNVKHHDELVKQNQEIIKQNKQIIALLEKGEQPQSISDNSAEIRKMKEHASHSVSSQQDKEARFKAEEEAKRKAEQQRLIELDQKIQPFLDDRNKSFDELSILSSQFRDDVEILGADKKLNPVQNNSFELIIVKFHQSLITKNDVDSIIYLRSRINSTNEIIRYFIKSDGAKVGLGSVIQKMFKPAYCKSDSTEYVVIEKGQVE